MSEACAFSYYRPALSGMRDKVYLQVHFGAAYSSGKYAGLPIPRQLLAAFRGCWSSWARTILILVWYTALTSCRTCSSTVTGGALDYIQTLKKQGVVRHIGLSSHTPAVVHAMLDTGLIDVVMFSINPAYDYQKGSYGIGSVEDRLALYQRCEKEQVGITVMKPLAAASCWIARCPRLARH